MANPFEDAGGFDLTSNNAFEVADLDTLVSKPATHLALPVKKRSPKAILGLIQKGEKARKAQNWVQAAKYFNEAWAYEPENVSIVKALAEVVASMGARSKAIDLFLYALERAPKDSELAALAGQVALDMELFEQAEKLNALFIELEPLNPIGYVNRATALRKLDRFDDAVDMLQQVLPIIPDNADLWNVLGSVVNMRDDLDTAMPFYDEALRLDPKAWKTLNNLARALNDLGRYEEAVPYASKALKYAGGDNPTIGFGLAMAQLGAGRLPDAWGSYAFRLDKRRQDAIRYALEVPYLGGQDLKGKNVIVVPEQGVGDEILFLSALSDLLDEAGDVAVGCDKRLVDIVVRSFPSLKQVAGYHDKRLEGYRIRFFDDIPDAGRGYDGYIVMGDLFARYRPTVADFSNTPKGFFAPDEAKVHDFRQWLDAQNDDLKVGICWRSGLLKAERNFWYAQLERWGPIMKTKGVTFVNLQYGDCGDELAEFKERFGVEILSYPDLNLKDDLDEAAALTKSLDLVMSIGAQPAMSAFAVDQEIFWLFPFPPWWNFGARTHAPMHEKSQFFVADTPMEWDSAMEKAAAALQQKVSA